MKSKKNYEVADILELIKISNEFIERNRRVYERLAAGIPTQSILDALVPELVDLYGDYIMQIVQYAASLADISLAILTRSDLDDYDRALFYRQRRGIERKYDDMYEAGTLTIIEYSYDPVANPEVHDPVADMLRGGETLWKREKNKNE